MPENAKPNEPAKPEPPDMSNVDMSHLWDEDDHAAPMPGQQNKLYELEGMPVRFTGNDPRQFPERWNPQSKQWETFAGLTQIAFNGHALEKAEFKQLCESVGASTD